MWIKRVRRTLTVGAVVALAGVVAAGCGDDDEQTAPTTGQIGVTTVTTGDNPDADGYAVSLDGNIASNIGVNDQVVIPDLAPNTYSVGLTNVAANCTVVQGLSYTHLDAIGDTANQFFFAIRSVVVIDNVTRISDGIKRVGEFDFGVVPGS